jgi:hypothetical protein
MDYIQQLTQPRRARGPEVSSPLSVSSSKSKRCIWRPCDEGVSPVVSAIVADSGSVDVRGNLCFGVRIPLLLPSDARAEIVTVESR